MRARRLTTGLAWALCVAWTGGTAVVGAAGGQGAALAAPPGPPLTLQDAIATVRVKHPDLAALRAKYEADRLKPEAERVLMPPMVEMQAVEWPLDTLNPGNAKLMIMLGQEFPGRGKRDLRASLAEREAAMTGAQVAVREQDLVFRVRRAYVDLQLARHTVEAYRAIIDLLRETAEAAEIKYAAGRADQQDILKVILERSMLEEQVVMADEQARVAEATLNVLLDRPAETPIGAIDPFVRDITVPAASDMQRLALVQQPELTAVDADVARREAALAVTRKERGADYLLQGGFMVMPNATNAWTARFGFTWSGAPWTKRRFDAMEKEAAAQIEASRAQRSAVENALRLMVQEAWVKADAAVRRAALLETSVLPQARHVLDVSRVAYQADRADFLDILDNERRLLDAELGVLRALAARDAALAELWRAVGSNEPATAAGASLAALSASPNPDVTRVELLP